MKAQLQQLIGMAVLGLALGAPSLPAWAGNVSLFEVYIYYDDATHNSGGASGSMAGARYSADSLQYIGCGTQNPAEGATFSVFVECFAKDSTGKYVICDRFDDERFAAVLTTMTDSSFISFTWKPVPPSQGGYNRCDTLAVHNSSVLLR
jgi:hypothetical protein